MSIFVCPNPTQDKDRYRQAILTMTTPDIEILDKLLMALQAESGDQATMFLSTFVHTKNGCSQGVQNICQL